MSYVNFTVTVHLGLFGARAENGWGVRYRFWHFGKNIANDKPKGSNHRFQQLGVSIVTVCD